MDATNPAAVGLLTYTAPERIDYAPQDLFDDGGDEPYEPEGLSAEQIFHEHITGQFRAPGHS